MKFGVREICDVVFKAKANQKIGKKQFFKGEPIMYFDTLKTSTLEGAVTTVYAQGGRGNARLIGWDGEKTVTFTMEDALISPESLSILAGAGLIDASAKAKLNVHVSEITDQIYSSKTWSGDMSNADLYIVTKQPIATSPDASHYAMVFDNGELMTEPFTCTAVKASTLSSVSVYVRGSEDDQKSVLSGLGEGNTLVLKITGAGNDTADVQHTGVMMVDYYTEKASNAQQIDITPDKFGGNFYIEASTLFRNQEGVDMPAEFIIPNAKVQSNFTFTMASSGDPSTFTFTMDAFPDYTRFNKTEKVFASIQIITDGEDGASTKREKTNVGGSFFPA